MRIDITCFTGNSGLTDYSVSLARSLKEQAEVRLLTASSLSHHFADLGFGIEYVFRRSRHYPLDIFKFIFTVLKNRPDWVLFQGPLKIPVMDAILVRLLRLLGIKCAVTIHDVLPHYPRPWSRLEFGFYYRSFNKAILHSLASEAAVKKMGVASPTLVVPHGIYDIFKLSNLTRSAAREHFPRINETTTVVLFFGNLESRKGLWEILDTAKAMQGNDTFFFLIAGAPHLGNSGEGAVARLEQAKKYSNCLIVDRRIEFQDVEKYFSAADLIALPYLEGTTSGVLKLALAFSKPVIATNVGDFPEQVPDGAGIFIEPNNLSSDLQKALITMQGNLPAFVEAMRAGGAKAQWHDIAKKIYNFLKS